MSKEPLEPVMFPAGECEVYIRALLACKDASGDRQAHIDRDRALSKALHDLNAAILFVNTESFIAKAFESKKTVEKLNKVTSEVVAEIYIREDCPFNFCLDEKPCKTADKCLHAVKGA